MAFFFGETVRGQRAGQEVSLGKTFVWEGEEWQIPAVYLCGKRFGSRFFVQGVCRKGSELY